MYNLTPNDDDAETRNERNDMLIASSDRLTARQATIMARVVDGESPAEIMTAMGLKKGVLLREIAIASSLIVPA